jgi:MerR family transcriptional regulator/heat shock protein HspR
MAFGSDSARPVYTLSVAAELLGTLPRVLMAYEEYELVVPTRTKTNRRRYSQLDIEKLQIVHYLHTKKGVNLVGIRLVLELLDELRRRGADVERVLGMS